MQVLCFFSMTECKGHILRECSTRTDRSATHSDDAGSQATLYYCSFFVEAQTKPSHYAIMALQPRKISRFREEFDLETARYPKRDVGLNGHVTRPSSARR